MQQSFPAELNIEKWGNPRGKVLFFLHANSYSARMYHPFLEPLATDHHIWSPDLPGHGNSRWNGRIQSWEDLADYFIEQLEKTPPQTPMVGMGHSIGGIVMMIMASKRPDWFEKLILLDPVMLPKRILMVMRVLRLFSLTQGIPLAKAAIKRRDTFASRAEAREHYAQKAIFSRWEPRFLDAYVESCLHDNDSGSVQLSCAPQLESSIYQSIPLSVWSLPKRLNLSALFIIGTFSDTVNHRGINRLRRCRGNHIVKTVKAGHLFPFEKPAEAMALIKDYLHDAN